MKESRWFIAYENSIGISISWGNNYKGYYICMELPFVMIQYHFKLKQ